jgi:hypothetical protein
MDTTLVESILLNVPIDDAEFRKPEPGGKDDSRPKSPSP